MKNKLALIVGNSDGIGLSLTKRLLSMEWRVTGLSKSPSRIDDKWYRHVVVDVTDEDFIHQLRAVIDITPDLLVYCVGIGDEFSPEAIEFEQKVFQVNLIGAVRTIETVLPGFIKSGCGQIVVLSSLADVIISPEAPSYSASKAGLSTYVEGLALAVRKHGVSVTNVRFGFVDTKMAKGDKFLWMMTAEKAVDHLLRCLKHKPIRYSRPRLMAVVVVFVRWFMRLRVSFSGGIASRRNERVRGSSP